MLDAAVQRSDLSPKTGKQRDPKEAISPHRRPRAFAQRSKEPISGARNGLMVSRAQSDTLIPYNYVVFGVNRYEGD